MRRHETTSTARGYVREKGTEPTPMGSAMSNRYFFLSCHTGRLDSGRAPVASPSATNSESATVN